MQPSSHADDHARPTELYAEPVSGVPAPRLEEVGRLVDIHNVCQSAMVQLTGGVFLTGYALSLGAPSVLIGLLGGLPFMVKLSQLYLSWRIERAGRWRRSALDGAVLGRAALLVAAIGPMTIAGSPGAPWLLAVIIAGSALGATVFEMSFQTWMAELIPEDMRGEFWGRRARVVGITGLVFALVAAFAIDQSHTGVATPPSRFAVLFAVGALIGMLGMAAIRRIPSPRRHSSRVELLTLRTALARPARDLNFMRLMRFVARWGAAGGFVAPFFAVYMLRELQLSFLTVTIFTVITSTVMSLTQLYWGKLGDHFGAKTTLRAGTYLIVLTPLLWLVTTPDRIWPIVVIQLLAGFGWGAYHLSLTNLVLKLAPHDARPSYLATFGATQGVAEAVAPILGGLALDGLMQAGVSWRAAFFIMIALSALVFASATPLLGRVREPRGQTVGRMIRVMGRFRSMSTELFGDFLFDYVYLHVARIADFIAKEEPHTGEHSRVT